MTPVCATCGAQFPPAESPPEVCPICADERQYLPPGGQRWTSAEALAGDHAIEVAEQEPGLLGLAMEPRFAIGQRALAAGGLLWDCMTIATEEAVARVTAAGTIHTIAISHPHYYTGMVDWAEALDARVLLHEADREWITRPSDRVELWSGERLEAGQDHELIRLGGHFEGGTICRWRGARDGVGVLLTGDIVQVVADRDWVTFMRSYPNYIPLAAREVARMRAVLAELDFDRLYGAFWTSVMGERARAKVLRSADRYPAALQETGPSGA
jgi:hypothetical protein